MPPRASHAKILLLSSLLLVPMLSSAQTLPAAQTAPAVQSVQTAALTRAEARALFVKTRPATFKLEIPGAGYGTGFFISADGYALTAYHVVENTTKLDALTTKNETLPLEVIGFDAAQDIALVKATSKTPLPFVKVALESPIAGQNVLAIGNSGGDFLQSRVGKLLKLDVTADRADFPSGTFEMSAPLAPGDSGGPIFNVAGEVIGVTSYIKLADGNLDFAAYTPENFLSYAVSLPNRKALLTELRAGVKHDVPVLGIKSAFPDDLPDDVFATLGLGSTPGAVVETVRVGGPAAKAGLKPLKVIPGENGKDPRVEADVITAVDGLPVHGFVQLLERVRQKRIGDKVTLTVQRGTETVKIMLELGAKAEVFKG